MLTKKIYLIYENFSDANIKEFELLAKSGFRGYRRNFTPILKALKELKKKNFFDGSDEYSTDYILKKTKLKRSTLLSRYSELLKISEYFSIIDNVDRSKQRKNLLLLDSYYENKSYKLFDQTFYQTKKDIEAGVIERKTNYNLFDLYDKGMLKAFYSGDEKNFVKYNFLSLDYATLSYLTEILCGAMETVFQQKLGRTPDTVVYDIVREINVDEIIEMFKKKDKKRYEFINTLNNFYKMFVNFDDKKYFVKAVKCHKKNLKLFSDEWNNYFYPLSINYCIYQTNLKREEFYRELFNIINEKFKAGNYNDITSMNYPVNNFRDYIFIALHLNEIKWAKNFVDSYSQYLPKEFRQDEINISRGLIYIEETRYEEALDFLKRVKKSNYIHYIDASLSIARCYYKLGLIDEGFEETARLRSYLNYHNDIPENHKRNALYAAEDMCQLMKYASGSISKLELGFYYKKLVPRVLKKWITEEFIRMI